MSRRNSCFVVLGLAWLVSLAALPPAVAQSPALLWTGSQDNTWSLIDGSLNWSQTGTQVPYTDGATVTFDDTSNPATTNIVIDASTTVNPYSITFNSTVNPYSYSFSGGTIGGAGSLTLNGTGTVVLNNVNTYTGGTYIEGPARLQLGSGASLGAGALTVNAGTLDLGGNSQSVTNLNGVAGTITSSVAGPVTLTVNPTPRASSAANCKMVRVFFRWP